MGAFSVFTGFHEQRPVLQVAAHLAIGLAVPHDVNGLVTAQPTGKTYPFGLGPYVARL